jgi:hypothetical protein
MAMLVLAFGLMVMQAKADEPAGTTDVYSATAETMEKSIDTEAPMSIYNDQLRCFKFKIDHAVVTVEEAAAFTVRYRANDNPEIIGAFPDDKTNSLCVIAAPEAEQAIRNSLATWIVELQGIPGSPLTLQLRELEADRAARLSDLAQLEMKLVETKIGVNAMKRNRKKMSGETLERMDSAIQQNEAMIQPLEERMESMELELAITEGKLRVANKYLKRISNHQN